MAASLPGQPLCDICGDWGARDGLICCSNRPKGCCFARHQWCFKNRSSPVPHQDFLWRNIVAQESLKAQRNGANGVQSLMASTNDGCMNAADIGHAFQFNSEAQPPQASGGLPLAGSKRSNATTLESSRPTSRTRTEPEISGGPVDLFKSTMQGLQKEQQRRQASRLEAQTPLPGAHASESRSEQRLKRTRGSKAAEPPGRLRAYQRQVVNVSIQEEPLWSGSLQLNGLPEAEEVLLAAHSLAGNPHAMDAVLRIPSEPLLGEILKTSEILEMSGVEACENACLVFRGSDENSQHLLEKVLKDRLPSENLLIQVLLGDNKPLWLALVPSLPDTLFGIFVKFDEQWTHSKAEPSKGLLHKKSPGLSRKVEWPDGQESNRRATDCERGRGSDYGHLRIHKPPDLAQGHGDLPQMGENASTASRTLEMPEPGPLSFLSVAIIGFQRDHEEIVRLRRDLTAAGAQTFTAPWPGCVKVLVFPEQLFNKDLTLENHAPKELQPIKDFQAAHQTRIFLRIDYPRLCCKLGRLPTAEEEARHNVRELWPEGCIITADASTLHAAATQGSPQGSDTLLEQVLIELKKAASCARRSGTVWMLTTTKQHLQDLGARGSPAHKILLSWQQTKRFQLMDSGLASQDLVLNALKLAQFYRFFCRYTLVLTRPEDEELIATADARKTVFCVGLDDVTSFLADIRTGL